MKLTQAEKTEIVRRMLARYQGLGSLLVRDDVSLCRLLSTLEIGDKDRKIGDYLTSFLVA